MLIFSFVDLGKFVEHFEIYGGQIERERKIVFKNKKIKRCPPFELSARFDRM